MANKKQSGENEKSISSFHDADILEEVLQHVGDFGRYQKLLIMATMPLGFTFAYVYFVQMFITVTPENYWCRIPELANLSVELRRNLSAPGALTGQWDHCQTFDTNWTKVLETLTPPTGRDPLVPCQHGWEFELSDIPYHTVTTEREWVCDRASYIPFAQSVFFVGSVTGTFTFGLLADRFGRVPAVIATNLIGGVSGVATIFTSGLWDFVFCRFLAGLTYDNCFMILYIIILEFVGSQYRTWVANLILAFSFAIAGITLPWMALYIADWRMLMWVTSAPMFIVILAPWFLPESVRWLVSRGRGNEAVTILKRIERINRTKIPDEIMDEFIVFSNRDEVEDRQSIFSMLRSTKLRNTMIKLIIVFMGCGCVFDGVMRLSNSFGLSFFAVFSVNEVSEFMAIVAVAVLLDRFGRRTSTCGPALICSTLLFIASFVRDGLPRAGLAIAARLFSIISYTGAMQWCTEIIPTPFRASGVSILHMSAYLANVFSPFIVFSDRIWSKLPLVIFNTAAFITTAVFMTLPETKGLPMPQTRADGEKIIREHSLFSIRRKDTENSENNAEIRKLYEENVL
ncbi:unnamed protein product [Arctia plantaginis]|uniref:Major facilitator superfamily (MFS) profile domain-containing protein n=1 Tax=Arctia plantaginis TaxID=874455 RepID=A0A8S1AJ73_ARCPL|nr:unnamed protein product [Arctia plantaginis]